MITDETIRAIAQAVDDAETWHMTAGGYVQKSTDHPKLLAAIRAILEREHAPRTWTVEELRALVAESCDEHGWPEIAPDVLDGKNGKRTIQGILYGFIAAVAGSAKPEQAKPRRVLTDDEKRKKAKELWDSFSRDTLDHIVDGMNWAIAESYPDYAAQATELTDANYWRERKDAELADAKNRIEELTDLVSHWQSVIDDTDETADWEFGDVRWRDRLQDRLAERFMEKNKRIIALEKQLTDAIEKARRVADLVVVPLREQIEDLETQLADANRKLEQASDQILAEKPEPKYTVVQTPDGEWGARRANGDVAEVITEETARQIVDLLTSGERIESSYVWNTRERIAALETQLARTEEANKVLHEENDALLDTLRQNTGGGDEGEQLTPSSAELAELKRDHEAVGRLRAVLAEAMKTRHYCDMEQDPDLPTDQDAPYRYDKCLIHWAEVYGCRVYSNWPNPRGYQEAAKAVEGK